MAKWKCRECGDTVESSTKPEHCPEGHTDIKKVHTPLSWLMRKLRFKV